MRSTDSRARKILRRNISHLLEAKSRSQAAVSRAADLDRTWIGFVRGTGKTEILDPGVLRIKRLAEDGFGVTLNDLFDPELAPETGTDSQSGAGGLEEMVEIPELDVRAAAGAGQEVHRETTIANWRVPLSWLRAGTKARIDGLCIITIIGDSMQPTLFTDQRVLVDTSDTIPSPSGLFAINDGHSLLAKRLEFTERPDPPAVRQISDNPAYKPKENLLSDIIITGRVLAKWQWL